MGRLMRARRGGVVPGLTSGLTSGLILGLTLTAAAAVAATPDCQCRHPGGERRDLGTIECLDITGTRWLVRCEMSTNTPYWRRLRADAGCTPPPMS